MGRAGVRPQRHWRFAQALSTAVTFLDPSSAMGEFELKLKRKLVPDEELLADLRRVAALLQRATLTRDVYDAHGRFSALTLRKRFGGWGGALAAARLAPTGYRNVSDEDLFENLADVWRALGRQPGMDDMHPAGGLSRYSASTYPRRFGSWNAALLRFSAYRDGSDWRSGSRGDALAARASPSRTSPPALRGPTSPRQLQPWRDELPSLGAGPGETTGVEPLQSRAFPSLRPPLDVEKEGPTPAVGRGKMRRSRRTPSWRMRARVLLRDRSTCQMCGASPAKDPATVLHVDHIAPWSKGGETVEANLRTLCEACNVGRGAE